MKKHPHCTVKPLFFALTLLPVLTQAQVVQLDDIDVVASVDNPAEQYNAARIDSADSARLLQWQPGIGLSAGGGISSAPTLHGLDASRVKIALDGQNITAACGNNMNPPLSYIAPSQIGKIDVLGPESPVSAGGDHLGGVIQVQTPAPRFAPAGSWLNEAIVGANGRGNGRASGGTLDAALANDDTSLNVSAMTEHADNYTDGQGNEIKSTYYTVRSEQLNLAHRDGSQTWRAHVRHQEVPGEGFANQRMDLIGNRSDAVNLSYEGLLPWGKLAARVYWQDTRHQMDVGADKSQYDDPMFMPMNTHGRDVGYALSLTTELSGRHTLRIGNEFHRFTLDDWWPPVSGTGMAPNTFWSIRNGRRDRIGVFGEVASAWLPQWSSNVGLRLDQVHSNADNVQGYRNSGSYATDSAAFNAAPRDKTDLGWGLSAQLRYRPDPLSQYRLGLSQQTRFPSLYERYAWSSNWMASEMINWAGDGNAYVGNLNLKPEVARTFNLQGDWHDADQRRWQVTATPYYSYVQDYIGVEVLRATPGENKLRFANHNAELYGIDLSGKLRLWDDAAWGMGEFKAVADYVHGCDLSTGTSLYHMMPLNARLSLTQSFEHWQHELAWWVVSKKRDVDAARLEPQTAGYSLLNWRASYQWRRLSVDFSVDNLFNKYYQAPLAGVYADLALQGLPTIALPAPGRSINLGLSLKL
ncbi:TonB-dependent receptor [Paludibacterium purpuratum]|uniref:Iron complex outermembrane receptor protein n=1 Tax=Paludibacterium purpuratum TaxID=1144873 RepID=A0A4R7BDV6_9NEIS|nr:TonB-dependent receptor [Paludibacterium purpuratum]TDR81946.1 iron complex outermembrane receptor protein [Paludibacterium purpuratum]